MLKDLLEGIVVPPTIGGQPRLSLPKVIGITVSPGEGGGTNIVIEIQPIEVETRGLPSTTTLAGDPDNEVSVKERTGPGRVQRKFPVIEFNIGDYMDIEGLEPPYDISLIDIVEKKRVGDGELYSPDNPYLTIDENGNVKYTPRGIFDDNILYLNIEIAGEGALPSAPAQKKRRVYAPEQTKKVVGREEVVGNAPLPEDKEKVLVRTKEGWVPVVMTDTVIGKDIDEVDEFHLYQGADATCYLASLVMMLGSQGIRKEDGSIYTYDDIVDLFAIEVDPDTGVVIGEPPPFLIDGNAAYVKAKIYGKYRVVWAVPTYPHNRYYQGQGTLIPYVKQEYIGLKSQNDLGRGLEEHFPVKVELGKLKTPWELIARLARGESLVLSLDSIELYASALVRDTPAGRESGGKVGTKYTADLNMEANHAIVVHGIRTTADGEIYAVVNDSAGISQAPAYIETPIDVTRTPPGPRYVPLLQLFGAAQDSNFDFVSIGPPAGMTLNPNIPSVIDVTVKEQEEDRGTIDRGALAFLVDSGLIDTIMRTRQADGTFPSKKEFFDVMTKDILLVRKFVNYLQEKKESFGASVLDALSRYGQNRSKLREIIKAEYPGLDTDQIDTDWEIVQNVLDE